ncbi:MAG: sigma 54-interacting transcriptional regulator [Kiritimatiellia bacterium]
MANDKQTSNVHAQTLILSHDAEGGTLRVRKTKLLVVSGSMQGREFVINNALFTLGSGSHNDIVLTDSTISKCHCEISVDSDGYLIRDLESTNGTFIQGVRVSSAYLTPGAEVQLGKTRLVFCPLPEANDIPLSRNENFGAMIGRSMTMRRVFYLAETYAPTEATVMITGETGTGKEILAEEIHRHSLRRDKPFIVIDCAAMAKDLIESELFGHVKGAFTSANADREGAFELADGGTVFLDEIGDLSPDLQPKLLRVLEKREIKRVGENRIRKINVRIICATNRMLATEVNEGRFREDLYYRLSVVQMELPPLRRRRDDIALLVKKFLCDMHGPNAKDEVADFDRTMDVLKRHEWPGNVRELRNLIEVAFYSEHRPLNLSAFLSLGRLRSGRTPEADVSHAADKPFKDAKNELIEGFEKSYLQDLLSRNRDNISRSAREAGIERAYLQRLIKKYGLK